MVSSPWRPGPDRAAGQGRARAARYADAPPAGAAPGLGVPDRERQPGLASVPVSRPEHVPAPQAGTSAPANTGSAVQADGYLRANLSEALLALLGSAPQRCIATAASARAGRGGRAGLQGGRRGAAGAAAGAADAGRADGGAAAGQPVAGLPQGGLGRGRGGGERAQRCGLSLLRAGRRMAPRLGSAPVWAAKVEVLRGAGSRPAVGQPAAGLPRAGPGRSCCGGARSQPRFCNLRGPSQASCSPEAGKLQSSCRGALQACNFVVM